MNNRLLLLISLVCFTSLGNAGDIATERTQAATGVIVSKIQQISEDIKEAEERIEDYENLAHKTINEIAGGLAALPGAQDVFNILRNVELVIQEGEALAHTAESLEEQMNEKFGTYGKFYQLISDSNGIVRENFEERFEQWSTTHLDTITNTLKAHGIHSKDIDNAEARLVTLQNMSRSAVGRMQALQIGQEIATEEIKQIHSLKEILMEQSNMHASYFAVRQSLRAEREAVDAWILRDSGMPTIVGNEAPLPYQGRR